MSEQSIGSGPIKILTDKEELEGPVYFGSISEVLVKVIQGSDPRFSIGILGDWGTGKTTLMRLIKKKLEEYNKPTDQPSNIVTVWFNAWRYEREEQYAIMPLLKTIAYAIPGNTEELRDLKGKVKRAGMNILKHLPDVLPSLTKQFFGEGAEKFTEGAVEAFKKEFIPKFELLTEVDRETIYYDGIEKIDNAISSILDNPKTESFRIVVFVDDLDRCSPKRALEVFESVKVFLDIEGFIFVIGLSLTTVVKLIEIEYKDTDIKGRDYIRKIIQIPIFLPTWNTDDTLSIINNLIHTKQLEGIYADLIKKNKDIIKTVIEPNPREVKRFINNFIIGSELFLDPNTDKEELLIVQGLQFRWDAFYQKFISDSAFRHAIITVSCSNSKYYYLEEYLEGKTESKLDMEKSGQAFIGLLRDSIDPGKAKSAYVKLGRYSKNLELDKSRVDTMESYLKGLDESLQLLSREYMDIVKHIQSDLWDYLIQNSLTISNIENWGDYRRAARVSREKEIHDSFLI